MSDLYEAFHEYFEIVIADTPKLLEEVYRIRYQVLCVEKRLPGFDQSLYVDGLEKDDYDDHSSHVLLRYRLSGSFIGTVRLIQFDPLNPEKLFPVEKYAQLDSALCDMSKLPRQQTAEISRFVIVDKFGRRKSERRNLEMRKDHTERRDRRSSPHLVLALIAGVVRMCAYYDIRNWVSVMDPALNRLLSNFGMDLRPIGPTIDYHGLRKPYFMKISDALSKMKEKYPDTWDVVTEYGKYSRFLSN